MGRTSSVDTSPPTPRTSPPSAPRTSPLRSLSLTTPDKSATDTPLCWIATLLTLLASLTRSRRRLIVVPERLLNPTPNPSSLETPPSSNWSPPSPCAWRLSQNSPLSTFRRQGHEANRCRRSYQVYHRQGGLRNHHKGRTKGPKEEITRCTTPSWG